ncbi:hypothetical protein DICPUDRAFT_153271 [Dictyostelium purpureum]|uniref:G-protein coupled receptors family 2 profile 2 domain-containing protein n=1 Tax=Dictyostelium purpureum TaxID=5786 RepID=F0ZNG9_DICPU|nr:uncharacterized protein DICPUDRAFT_153271 [Dictyostelium purpureum]EGC34513.1 hypothetical protein DICPUDRAFT_153271 [Dictyostelium purpureum]|eukprot:XP_003288949.1 hypothetical protein DICPUDRAFT_153271 [Dictyostelium purpureum]
MKLFLFIVLTFISSISCQNIYSIDPKAKCEKYQGDTDIIKCADYLTNNGSVYIPGSTTQDQIMVELKMYFKLLGSYGGDACQTVHTSQSLCSMMLPECQEFQNIDTKEIVAIPKRVCRGTCTDVTGICGVSSLYNCSQLEEDPMQPKYPITNTIYNLTDFGQSFDYTIQCFDPPQNNQSTVVKSCPNPLVYRYTKTQDADAELGYVYVSNQSYCTIRCPAPIMSDSDWNSLLRESDALAFISLVCSIYLVITYLIVNNKKNKYDYFFGFFTGSILLMSVAGTMGLFSGGGAKAIICPEENRRAMGTDKACSASGFLFQFSIANAVLWWCIQSFELWYQIHFVNKKLEILKIYIPVVLVLSLAFSVPILGLGRYRAGLGNFLCWIDSGTYQNVFFWGPFAFMLTLGTVFIILVVYEIYKIMKSNSKKDIWKLQIKPLLNMILVYLTFIYLFGYNFWIHQNADWFYGSIVDFYTCLLNTDGSNCFIQGPPPSSLKMFAFCLRIYGVYAIILYGYNARVCKIWRESFIGVYVLNSSLANKLKNFSSHSRGTTSSTIKMDSNMTSQMDSGGGVSSSMENDDVTIY